VNGGVLLPWFVTVPSGFALVVFVMRHLINLAAEHEMDTTRRRIRQVNGIVMLMLVPVMTSGLSFFDWQARPAEWVISWSICVFLVVLMVLMATLDALNTARIAREKRAELREWLLDRSVPGDE